MVTPGVRITEKQALTENHCCLLLWPAEPGAMHAAAAALSQHHAYDAQGNDARSRKRLGQGPPYFGRFPERPSGTLWAEEIGPEKQGGASKHHF